MLFQEGAGPVPSWARLAALRAFRTGIVQLLVHNSEVFECPLPYGKFSEAGCESLVQMIKC